MEVECGPVEAKVTDARVQRFRRWRDQLPPQFWLLTAGAGVFLHGLSADLLVRKHPMTPVTATDVIGNIKGALQHTLGELPPEE
jgi:NAD(P)H-hydrate repair Nnr-like enzyme with NAD(P)H-hydrate dehydratase domain